MPEFTHAGGIVVRYDGQPQYLIVTAKYNPDHWVLPKGHIEPGESLEDNPFGGRVLRPRGGALYK